MAGNRSAILMYHSIDGAGSVISTSADEFERQLTAIAASGVDVVSLSDIRKKRGAVAITFDDGFRNFRTKAAPALERFGFPASVFVVSGFCGRDNQWPGQSASVPVLPLMDWAEVREIAERGFGIGAHTINHPDLSSLSHDEAAQEMTGCKAEIEQRLGRAVTEFAYPYGQMPRGVKPDFDLACGTRLSYVQPADDALELPRIDAYYLRGVLNAGSILSAPTAAYIGVRAIVRNLNQWLSR
jgi:peptidoglycan/xylan/chitin deacetylase (PgdA/CDA1 family)